MEELLDEPVTTEDLKKFEAIYYKEIESNNVSKESTFRYAWCLVRSKYASDIRKGISLLENLYESGNEKERRDYIYYLAFGYEKLREHKRALEYTRKFLVLEPGNHQVQTLEKTIRNRMEKDGLKGIAIAGGTAVAVGALVGLAVAVVNKLK